MDLDKAFERVDNLSMLDSLISLGISGRIITWIDNFLTNRKLKVKIQATISDPHDLTSGCPQGSTISPAIFNGLVAQLLTVTLPISVDILAYADDLVLISHGSRPAEKLQKALNAVDKAANSLGLYFSPAKTKTKTFNTNRQPKFKLGLQHLEMVNDYRYLGVTIDRRLSFIQHVADTKRKINYRFKMIKAITNLKIGVNTKMLITLYKHLIQSVILYAAPVLLLACNTALQNLERTQRVPLRYILGLPNETNCTMIYRESGSLPLQLLIKKETASYLLRAATKPIQTDIIQHIQEETQKDPEHHPSTTTPTPIPKITYLQPGPASSKDEEIRGRIPNHTRSPYLSCTHLHALVIHLDSMRAIIIITTANFHTYPEIITELYTTASALKQRGIQVILQWVPSHINLEGNDRTNKLANEATSLDVIEYGQHTPGTFNYLVDRLIFNRLESIYTSASRD